MGRLLDAKEQQSGRIGFEDDADCRMPGSPFPVLMVFGVGSQVAYKYHRVIFPKLGCVEEGEESFPRGITDEEIRGMLVPLHAKPGGLQPFGQPAPGVACHGLLRTKMVRRG